MAAAHLPLDRLRSRREADDLLRLSLPDATTRQFVLQNLVVDTTSNPASPHLSWRLNFPAVIKALSSSAWDLAWDQHDPCPAPALFVAGARSDYVRPEHHRAIGALFTDSQVHTIEGAGHWVHSEALAQFGDVVGAFLERIDRHVRPIEKRSR